MRACLHRRTRGLAAGLIVLPALLPLPTRAQPPAVQFVEVTAGAGIDFRHVHGGGVGARRRYFIETMGSGVAFLDYDNDGFLDLYVVNGQHLDNGAAPRATNELYRNRQDGTFEKATAAAGVGDQGYGMGVTAGDYDNDGHVDLYVTNYGRNTLYHNNGDGTFTDVTEAAGVGDEQWGVGGAFLDYDNDGDLDLYVANYLTYSLADADRPLRPYVARGVAVPAVMGYPHPDNFDGASDVLYRNEGNNTFTDVSRAAGVHNPGGKGMGLVCADYDDDGDVDVFVANDQTENFLYQNRGDGTFAEVGLMAGVAYDRNGQTQSSMGADFGDYDNDGDLDLFMTNYQGETSALYENEGNGFFTERGHAAGLALPSLPYVCWGTVFLDYDNDGDRDLFVANGHVLDNAEDFDTSSRYHQPNQLFRNEGPDAAGRYTFREVSSVSGPGLALVLPSRGAAAGDYDNDGDPDLVVLNSNLPLTLLRNDGGNRAHWLMVHLVGVESNRDALGARVQLEAGGRRQVAEAHSGCSYLSQSDPRIAFGLGPLERADRLVVRWPSGRTDVVQGVQADRLLTITEGQGVTAAREF